MKYQVKHLRCEYLKNPLAIASLTPRLSWKGFCERQGGAQSAYRILVSSSPENLKMLKGDIWDSGKVNSSKSVQITYEGKTLKSYQQVFWKIMAWDEKGREGSWSKPASWTMGLLKAKDWKASWIGNHLGASKTSPLLRKEFKTHKKIKRALLHASALGLYHIQVNGRNIGDDLFAPGWTDYSKRRYYRGYDVTKHLKSGRHCIGAEIAYGWYKGTIGWEGHTYGSHTAILVQLRIEYMDGSVETISSDASWKSSFGHTMQAGFYEGESVDAQLEPKGWSRVGFDDSKWGQVVTLFPANGVSKDKEAVSLEPYPAEPVRETETLQPVSFWTVSPGKVIYDFGQNFAGCVRIQVKGKAGAIIRMRFGEMINDDKSLYVENLRSAISTDTYVMKGLKRETWQPKFTFHGFRYVEVTGLPVKASIDSVVGVVLGSDTTRVGKFNCSNPMINKVYSNALWTQRANFLEVPTDCPQRDERLGWTGDAQVFIRTAIGNMDVAAFFTKWMNDLIDAQTDEGAFPNIAPNILLKPVSKRGDAAWGDAGVVCPWTLFQCYEDRALLTKMYPHMQAWVSYLKKTSKAYLRHPDITPSFGDWLSIGSKTPIEIVQTAYFALATDITRQAAEVLGKEKDAKNYKALFSNISKAFSKAYVSKNGKIKGDTQTAYCLALKFGLLNDSQSKMAAKHLVNDIRKNNDHLSTGFVGTALIMSVLRDTGNLELAYRLLENTTYPSWGYSVKNGATSIWERWNGWTKKDGPGDVNMNSYSHYAYGAVVEWMYDTIAGIDHTGKGFQNIILKPQPGGSLKHAEAEFDSPYGIIKSSWRKNGTRFIYDITIPTNTQATVKLPVTNLKNVKLNHEWILDTDISISTDHAFSLGSGTYSLSF